MLEIRKVDIKELRAQTAPPAAGKRFPAVVPQPSKAFWKIADDELTQPALTTAELYFGDPKWTDYDFEVQAMRTKGNDGFGMLLRRGDERTFYFYRLGAAKSTVHAQGWHDAGVSSQTNTLDIKDNSFQSNVWYTAKTSVRGEQGECWLDGVKLFDFKADKHAAGAVGLTTMGSGYRFKNIKVTAPDGTVLLKACRIWRGGGARADGFVSLFDGKVLNGWKKSKASGNWSVKNGILTGSGADGSLFTRRATTIEISICPWRPASTTAARRRVLPRRLRPVRPMPKTFTYRASLNSNCEKPIFKTGNLSAYLGKSVRNLPPLKESVPPAGTWFTLEVIAKGTQLRVKVDDKAGNFLDDKAIPRGRFILQADTPQSVVEIRKIEIKELAMP